MTSKIHVAQLIGSTGLYGAERWILALMRALDPAQVQSTLVNLVDRPGEKSDVADAAGRRGLQAIDFYTGGRLNPWASLRLARWAKQRDVHVIHGHGFKPDMVGLLAARIARCRIITTPHGWSFEDNWKLRLYETLDRELFRFMDRICPLSPELEKEIKARGDGKVNLIFNGLDLDELEAAPPAERAHPDEFLIGYIGQLIDRKDLKTLLGAVRLLWEERARVRLMVIGDGPKRVSLQEQVAELGLQKQVDFLGFRSDALSFLKTFDTFVLPSLMEGIPRCVMEAMAAGIPVVASDIPGNRELVVHGKTGLLFRPGSPEDLSEKISYLMRYPDDARVMAARAREKVEREFSNRRMAEEYTKLYKELVGKEDVEGHHFCC